MGKVTILDVSFQDEYSSPLFFLVGNYVNSYFISPFYMVKSGMIPSQNSPERRSGSLVAGWVMQAVHSGFIYCCGQQPFGVESAMCPGWKRQVTRARNWKVTSPSLAPAFSLCFLIAMT